MSSNIADKTNLRALARIAFRHSRNRRFGDVPSASHELIYSMGSGEVLNIFQELSGWTVAMRLKSHVIMVELKEGQHWDGQPAPPEPDNIDVTVWSLEGNWSVVRDDGSNLQATVVVLNFLTLYCGGEDAMDYVYGRDYDISLESLRVVSERVRAVTALGMWDIACPDYGLRALENGFVVGVPIGDGPNRGYSFMEFTDEDYPVIWIGGIGRAAASKESYYLFWRIYLATCTVLGLSAYRTPDDLNSPEKVKAFGDSLDLGGWMP